MTSTLLERRIPEKSAPRTEARRAPRVARFGEKGRFPGAALTNSGMSFGCFDADQSGAELASGPPARAIVSDERRTHFRGAMLATKFDQTLDAGCAVD